MSEAPTIGQVVDDLLAKQFNILSHQIFEDRLIKIESILSENSKEINTSKQKIANNDRAACDQIYAYSKKIEKNSTDISLLSTKVNLQTGNLTASQVKSMGLLSSQVCDMMKEIRELHIQNLQKDELISQLSKQVFALNQSIDIVPPPLPKKVGNKKMSKIPLKDPHLQVQQEVQNTVRSLSQINPLIAEINVKIETV